MTKKLPYKQYLVPLAKSLRNNSTPAEKMLWKHLQSRKFLDCKFSRQKPIDEYIVDFFCGELQLVIEVDGSTHDKETTDVERQQRLEELGCTVIRFREGAVRNSVDEVLKKLEMTVLWLREKQKPDAKGIVKP